MTLPAQNPMPQIAAVAGQTIFPFSWRCDDSLLVTVWVNDVQVGGSAVALNADQSAAPGGTVTLAAPSLAGDVVTIERVTPQIQTVDIAQYGKFASASVNAALDRMVMLLQEEAAIAGRAVRATRSSLLQFSSLNLPDPVAGQAIAFQVDPVNPALVRLGLLDVAAYVSEMLGGFPAVQPLSWVVIGDGATKNFNIAGAVVGAADLYLTVIDGVPQEPYTDYAISLLGTPQIQFGVAPPLNARCLVRSFGYAKAASIGDATLVKALGSTTARTLGQWFADSANVKAYGAVGDGVTDDGPAFRAALAANKRVYAPDPAVAYLVKTTIPVPANSTIIGSGKWTTKFLLGANVDMFTLADGSHLRDIYADGNAPTWTGRGVVISGTDGHQGLDSIRLVNFDGYCIEFTVVGAGSQFNALDCEIARYHGDPTAFPGRFSVKVQDAVNLTAVPRKFFCCETNGTQFIDLGGSNNTYLSGCFTGGLNFSTNTRAFLMVGGRIANQAALTVDGHNICIIGCDILPALTIAAASDHIVIGPDSLNTNLVSDLSASVNGTFITQAPVLYAPALTASTANPVIGNGTLRGEYSRNGSVIHCVIEYTVGSTDTPGTGTWRFSLPITPPGQAGSPTVQIGDGYVRQNAGATFEFVKPVVVNGTAYVVLQRAGAGGSQVASATPWVWATGDIVRLTIDYHL